MKKLFEEFGGVIITVVAVCCLIGFCAFIMIPTGAVAGAFDRISFMFTDKAQTLIQDVGSIDPNGGAGGSGEGEPGNVNQSKLVVLLDSSLSNNSDIPSFVAESSFILSGKVTGGNGTVSFKVNDVDVPVDEDGFWSITLTLPYGETVVVSIVATSEGWQAATVVGYVQYTDFEEVTLNSGLFDEIGYDRSMSDLEIPATFQKDDGTWCKITAIGYGAFQNHTNLVSVKVPEGVVSLDSNAFYGCTGLSSVGLAGSGAAVELPSSLVAISYSAFEKCSGITSVVVPRNVQRIYSSAFEQCSLLADVKFEDDSVLTNIYEYAFSECPKLTSVGPAGSGCDFEFPNSLARLYREVFSRDTNITKFIIPDSMTSLDPDAFAMLTGLKAFEVSDNHPAYCAVDGVLYTKDMKTLVRYPAGKTASSFAVPESVTTIGKYAFEDSVNLCNVTLPSGLTSLSYYAFAFCSNLQTITIPASVTYISSYVFYNCFNMETAVFENISGWSVSKDGAVTNVDVTDIAVNAQSFIRTYVFHTWSRE